MILNAKIGVLMDFWRFWAAKHILRAHCAEFTTDRPRQSAYRIFSIKRRFQRSKSRPSRLHFSVSNDNRLLCRLCYSERTQQ